MRILHTNNLSGGIRLLAALAMLFFPAACGHKTAAPHERPPVTVKLGEARSAKVPLYIDEIGTNIAIETVSIVPQVSGEVVKLAFEDGAYVKKGDLLFLIDPRSYEAARDKAKAKLLADRATLEFNRAQLKRNESLVQGKFISEQDIENLKTQVAIYEATVKQDEADLRTAEINLEYCTMASPIEGKTGVHQVDVGNVVTAYNQGSMVTIQRLAPIFVDFTVAENDLPRVRDYFQKGQLKVQVYVPGEENDKREGEMFFLDNTVESGTGTVKLRAIVKNEDHHFWPGQFVNVRLILTEIPDAVVVPYSALQISHTGPFVFVAKDDSTVEFRAVTPGQRQGDDLVLAKGVQAGEKVVLEGQLMLSPGAKIHPVSDQADQTGQPQAAKEGVPAGEAK